LYYEEFWGIPLRKTGEIPLSRNFAVFIFFGFFLQQIKKILYLCPGQKIRTVDKQKNMRSETLFIQETKNRKALSIFMPLNLFAMNIFTTLSLSLSLSLH
jgi:hypothetical protein